ncbi:hypothetical protein B0H13DRAFT_2318658 [Mycena leptocephala]|nr:hypothetical protein B0H13DRAFT_2318658 [Mycena leptocephala]
MPKTIYADLRYDAPPNDEIVPFTTSFFRPFHTNSSVERLSKTILYARRKDYVQPTAERCVNLFKKVLPAMRFAMQTLDPKRLVPSDVTLFLGNVAYLLGIVEDLEAEGLEEYDGVIYPSFKSPSDNDMDKAPPLDTVNKKRKAVPSDEESEEALPLKIPDKAHKGKKPKLEGGQKSTKAKELVSVSDDEVPRSIIKGSHNLRTSNAISYPVESEEEDVKPKKVTKSKGGQQSIQSRVHELMPEIESAIVDLATSKKVFKTVHGIGANNIVISITHKQGSKKYDLKSSLGKGTDAESPIDPLSFVESVSLPIEQAIRPKWSCTLCIIFKVECLPNGIGIECVHCASRKLGAYCDHTANAVRLHNIVKNLRVLKDFIDPDPVAITSPHLHYLADRALTTQRLAADDRGTFARDLRKYLESASERNKRLGSAGFEALFTPEASGSARSHFNTLIKAFNETLETAEQAGTSEESEGSDAGSPHSGTPAPSSPPSKDRAKSVGKDEKV